MPFSVCRLLDIHDRDIRDRSVELCEIARTVDFGWVNIRQLNFVASGPKFTKNFFLQPGMGCS